MGKCSYGSSCRFSHDGQDITRYEESSGTTRAEGAQIREDYIEFKRFVRRVGAFSSNTNGSDCVETWTLVIKVLDAPNRELQQSVARDLADDELGGPELVTRTVRLCTNGGDLDISRAFLEAITHPSLLRCLSIDSFVGTIYRMIGGSNGDQGIAFFSSLNRHLAETSSSRSPGTHFALLVSSLYELLRRERKCLLHDDLPELLGAVEINVNQVDGQAQNGAAVALDRDAVLIQIDMMKRMVDGARGRLSGNTQVETIRSVASTIQSTFPMQVIIPGGKHDNDFADISKIQIFPTLGEIMSDAPEYLPVTDFTQSHFIADPVQRHLDSAFRLLRHDIFGPLKEVLSAILAQPDVNDAATSNRFISGNINAHRYSRATIQHVLIDGGLQACLSFAQPSQLRKHSPSDRRRWWEASSRLEPGNLVCFVSTRGDEKSFLLFVVTKKNTKNDEEEEKESSLVSERHNPAIAAKLASESQQNVAMLNRIYVEKQEGVLIELPGLIPETFMPILENLQQMMRDGDLAFRRWILPASDDNGGPAPTVIPPPAYARRREFRFRLSSITRAGHAALSLDPAAPANGISPEALGVATGLDRGQSESLIAALTREYALIQGPPGTGKSYVGVQLVRVLLDHKAEANLGPILVM
jgi:hypothetical protein